MGIAMTLMDNKGKLFGKVSIVDVLIVIVLLGMFAGLAFKLFKPDSAGAFSKTEKVLITFYAEEVPEYSVKAVRVGDVVKDGTLNVDLGKVTNVKIDRPVSFAFSDQGEWNASAKVGYNSIAVTSECEAQWTENGIKIGNFQYLVGHGVDIFWAGKSSFEHKIAISDIRKAE